MHKKPVLSEHVHSYFRLHRREIIKNAVLGTFFLLAAMALVGFRVLYPYHFLLAVPFLLLALRYKLAIVFLGTKYVRKTTVYSRTKHLIRTYQWALFGLLVTGILFYIGSQILPSDQDPYAGMSPDQITEYVDQSLDASVIHLDHLLITGNTLLESDLLSKNDLTADERAELMSAWDAFLQAAKASEEITDVHRYFGQISYWSQRESHTKSFVIAYALYIKKYEMFSRVINAVGTNERVIKALNEHSNAFGGKNSYYDIRNRHIAHETLLRRNLGRMYISFLELTINTKSFGEDYNALVRASKESYTYLRTRTIETTATAAITVSDTVENTLFDGWFPIQKSVADSMGKVIITNRDAHFITREQIHEMRPHLKPGDIFVERRNWHLSNVGIPGFWPHAALYIGTLDDAESFFSDVFPFEGYPSYSALLKEKYPALYVTYTQNDSVGDPYAVIEGQAPGIILQSLEKSAMADYVGVMRPRLTKYERLQALLRAFENYGKPYDYNFDFETRDEIVCSELVYDAYLPTSKSRGLTLPLTRTSGRLMISPNAFVEKFYNEHGTDTQELDFVYFIDGNESLQKAFVQDENAFLTSWTRSKFSNLQD